MAGRLAHCPGRNNGENAVGQIKCARRTTKLIAHDLKFVSCPGQCPHCFHKVFSKRTEDPASPQLDA
jgi:hypothetical protein